MTTKYFTRIALLPSLLLFLTVFLSSSVKLASSSNILFFHSFVTSSHRTAIWPLAEKLADRGHNVTYIFPVAKAKRLGHHPKIRELTPSKMIPILKDFVVDFDINIRLQDRENEWIEQVLGTCFTLCKAFYQSPEIIKWMEEPDLKFDLIMLDGSIGECGYGLVHKFKAKMIMFSPLIPPFIYDGLGIVPESSSLPDVLFHAKPTQMTFFSRVMSTVTPLLWRYKFMEYMTRLQDVVREGLNSTDLPPLTDIEANTSLVFINSHLIEDYPRSLPPMFVSYSGLWCSKEKRDKRTPLPENIANFIAKREGFFYVSFGSATVASKMPISMRTSFFNAFRNFPKLGFLWRWTGELPEDTPENVLLLPWFPQNDILAHPKIKGFMMQAGRPSSQEALCYGVPLIAVPIFADQDYNANRLEHVGAAIHLHLTNITEVTLTHSFKELLDNPKYKSRMIELSEQFRDRPMDPLDNVLYWTEYVLRRDTSIMRPLGVKQTWWERRLLDVYAFFLFVILASFGVFFILIRLAWKHIMLRYLGNGNKKVKAE